MSAENTLKSILSLLQSNLNKTKYSTASQSANNKSGIYGQSVNPDEEVNDSSMEKTQKRIDNLGKSADKLDKRINETVNNVSKGFSDIMHRTGQSIKNSIGLNGADRILQKGLKQINSDLFASSHGLRESITGYIDDITKVTGVNSSDILRKGQKQAKQLSVLNSILASAIKRGHINNEEIKATQQIYEDIGHKGQKMVDVFGDADNTMRLFLDSIINGDKEKIKINSESIKSIKSFNSSLSQSNNILIGSVQEMASTIDSELRAPFKRLGKEVDAIGPKLKAGIVGAAGLILSSQSNAINVAMQEGFRGMGFDDLYENFKTSFTLGQSQTELMRTAKMNNDSFRLFGNDSNALNVTEKANFKKVFDHLEDKFSMTGTDNTGMMAEMMGTLGDAGIRPTVNALIELADNIKTISVLDNKNAKETSSMFNSLIKDKNIKAYSLTLGQGKKTFDGLTKQMVKLKKDVGMTSDEFIDYQKNLANNQINTKTTDNIVKSAMGQQLLSVLNNKELNRGAEILRTGDISTASFEPGSKDLEEYNRLNMLRQQASFEMLAKSKKMGTAGAGLNTLLHTLTEGAGIDMLGGAKTTAKSQSGLIEFNRRNAELFEKRAQLQSTFFSRLSAQITNFLKGLGLKGGAMLSGVGGILGGLASGLGSTATTMWAIGAKKHGLKNAFSAPIATAQSVTSNITPSQVIGQRNATKYMNAMEKYEKLKDSGASSSKIAKALQKAQILHPQNVLSKTSTLSKIIPFLKKAGAIGTVISAGVNAKDAVDKAISEGKSDAEVTGRGLLGVTNGAAGFFTGIIAAVGSLPRALNDNITIMEALGEGYTSGSKIPEQVTSEIGDAVYSGMTHALETLVGSTGNKNAYIDRQNKAHLANMSTLTQMSLRRTPEEIKELKSYSASEAQQQAFKDKNQGFEEGIQTIVDFLGKITGNTKETNETLISQHDAKLLQKQLDKASGEMTMGVNAVLSQWNA